MRTIWKYTLSADLGGSSMAMPVGAKILSTAFQDDVLRLWAEVDDSSETAQELRRFDVFGTGHHVTHHEPHKFIGTVFHSAGLVFHVFERR